MTFTTDEIDFAKPYEQPSIRTHEDLMNYFEKRYQEWLVDTCAGDEKVLNKPWTLRNGDTIYSSDQRSISFACPSASKFITAPSWVFTCGYWTCPYRAVMARAPMKTILLKKESCKYVSKEWINWICFVINSVSRACNFKNNSPAP
jgi:hypothetical protein